MRLRFASALTIPFLFASGATAQKLAPNIPYAETGHGRHVLDVYTPEKPAGTSLPVLFWIHGGGWQAGDKGDVGSKPKVLTERGFVFVSTNYRLLPEVEMADLMGDAARSLGWVHRNIARYGGDPARIFVGGHSAGAQMAALLAADGRYLAKERVPRHALKGCVAVDGDTYDIPKIILTAEHRQALYGGKMFTFGHRQKFGNDPVKHVDFSTVTHVSKGKGIPPYLLLYFTGNPDTRAQAEALAGVLRAAEIPVRVYGAEDSNHRRLNESLGRPGDPATEELYKFLDPLTGRKR
ncbi:MAG: alpha/beta hydrolase [Acidobacteria bacterium]|nr:alpha/beta hydrolase [Acidobacteriota bacterium]